MFTLVGDSKLYYDPKLRNWENAKKRCEALDSKLVEFWTEEEYDKVMLFAVYKIPI